MFTLTLESAQQVFTSMALCSAMVGVCLFGVSSDAAEAPDPVAVWILPAWVNPLEGASGNVSLAEGVKVEKLRMDYVFSTGESGTVDATPDEDVPGSYEFSIPSVKASDMGTLKLTAKGLSGDASVTSATQTVPLSFWQECDITGPAAEVIPYAVLRDDMMVRYIPCCNIFGGVLVTERLTANPMENAKGLPEHLLSDFLILSPDPLSASTNGLHMRMKYDRDAAAKLGIEAVAPYTFNWKYRDWRPMYSYEVNPAEGYVDLHAPDGGSFILGELKPVQK